MELQPGFGWRIIRRFIVSVSASGSHLGQLISVPLFPLLRYRSSSPLMVRLIGSSDAVASHLSACSAGPL